MKTLQYTTERRGLLKALLIAATLLGFVVSPLIAEEANQNTQAPTPSRPAARLAQGSGRISALPPHIQHGQVGAASPPRPALVFRQIAAGTPLLPGRCQDAPQGSRGADATQHR